MCSWKTPTVKNATYENADGSAFDETAFNSHLDDEITAICVPGYEFAFNETKQTIICKNEGWDTTAVVDCRVGELIELIIKN